MNLLFLQSFGKISLQNFLDCASHTFVAFLSEKTKNHKTSQCTHYSTNMGDAFSINKKDSFLNIKFSDPLNSLNCERTAARLAGLRGELGLKNSEGKH